MALTESEKFRCIDPVYMSVAAGIVPDDWQETLLRTDMNALVNICRQAGKSTTSGMKALHKAYFEPGSTVVLVSKALRQSGELFRKVSDSHTKLDLVPTVSETKLTLELSNGSRILSLPGSEGTVRGISAVDLLIMDEASRIPDDLNVALRPMLAVSQGQLIAPSTPFGQRGWWYEAWIGQGNWLRLSVTAEDCPRIPPNFLEEERRELGDLAYRQEYCCEFIQIHEALFRPDDIAAAMSGDFETLGFDLKGVALPPPNVLHSDVRPLFE